MSAKKAKKSKVRTQVCVVLDQTGSMEPRKRETISGYNEYLQSLKKDQGDEVLFTLVLFSTNQVETRYNHAPVATVPMLDETTYRPDGGTPLYDAIGNAMHQMEKDASKDDLVIFAILTDGEENASKEYKLEAIKSLISSREKSGWKFAFLGVGIDGFSGGQHIGLSAASSFSVASKNTGMAYAMMAQNSSLMRSTYSTDGLAATVCMNVVTEKDRDKLSTNG